MCKFTLDPTPTPAENDLEYFYENSVIKLNYRIHKLKLIATVFFHRFLYQEDCKEYKYFAYKVQEFRRIKQEEKANEGDTEDNPDKLGGTKGVKRKRKSRWGPQEDSQPATAPGVGLPGVAANLQLGGTATIQQQGE